MENGALHFSLPAAGSSFTFRPAQPADGPTVAEFFTHVTREPTSLLPLQSAIGNIANTVVTGLVAWPFEDRTSARSQPKAARAADHREVRASGHYRPALTDCYRRTRIDSYGQQTPSLPGEALLWHQCFLDTGTMRM